MEIPFVQASMPTLVNELNIRLCESKKTFIVTANPEIAMYASNHPDYQHILQQADLVIPDGIGIVLAARLKRKPMNERLAGFDLIQELFALSEEKGYSLYFLGSKEQ